MQNAIPYPAMVPGRHRPPVARRSRRGLGLLDAALAVAVLSVLMLWGGQIVGDWAAGRVVTGEARTAADLARAGRLLLEGDINHPGRSHGVNAAPLAVPLADLRGAGLRSPALGDRTAGRRTLTLWLWRPGAGALLVIARARGEVPLARLPGAEDGVGVLLAGETRLRGSGVDFDMGAINAALPGFAAAGDLFALDYVALDMPCRSYLFRETVDGCPEASTMTVDLDMGGNDLTGAGRVQAATAAISALEGAARITGDLSVAGEMEVAGDAQMQNLTVNGVITAGSVAIEGTLTVPDLTATGGITGADLAFDGALTVSGEARLGAANAGTLNVRTLNVRQLSSDRGHFDANFADDVTVSRCTGCAP